MNQSDVFNFYRIPQYFFLWVPEGFGLPVAEAMSLVVLSLDIAA